MIATGPTVRGFAPMPGMERDSIAHDQSVVDIEMPKPVDGVGLFKGELVGIEPYSSAFLSANVHGLFGSDSCRPLFGHDPISTCKSGLGDWGCIGSARTNGPTVRLPLQDAGSERDAATKMQETQMSFNLLLPRDGGQGGTLSASGAAAAFFVRWEGPDLDAVVYNGHAGLGS